MTSTESSRSGNAFAGIQALQSRAPGYAAARECIRVQAESGTVDPHGRALLSPAAWSWYVGALGEIEVGEILRGLGPRWLVRHAVPIGAGATDVDHLLVGPPGVFVLNTKRHANASVWVGDHVLKVNGNNTHHLGAARHEAAEAARRLSKKAGFEVPVSSAIVLVGARSLKDIRKPESRPTTVLRAADLIRWLNAHPPILSPAQTDLIKLVAEEPETWHVDPRAADTFRVMARFERLRDEVGDAPESPYRPRATKVASPTRGPVRVSRPPRNRRVATLPAARAKSPRIVRSRAERIFWTVFLTITGIPVGLFLTALLIAGIASATSH